MDNKKLLLILLGLCGLLFAVLLLNEDKNHYVTDDADQIFLPELKQRLTEVAKIQIDSLGESVVLESQNNSWVVASKQNYPADTNSIRQLIYGMADLTIVEVKTADESLLSKIGLTQDSDDSVRVRIMDVDGNTISDILFGKSQPALSSQGQDWFVRQFDDAQSWLLNGQLLLNRNAYQWLSKAILSMDTDDIQEVVLNTNHIDSLVIRKTDESQAFELVGEKDSEEIEAYKLDEIVEAASSIQLDDVRLKSADQNNSSEATIQLKTKNGLNVEITVTDTEQGWINLIAQTEMTDQGVTEQSQALNKNWSEWEFQIPKYKLDTLLQKKQDLISKNQSS